MNFGGGRLGAFAHRGAPEMRPSVNVLTVESGMYPPLPMRFHSFEPPYFWPRVWHWIVTQSPRSRNVGRP